MAQRSGLDWILSEPELSPVISPLLRTETATVEDILFPFEFADSAEGINILGSPSLSYQTTAAPDEPCLLQHSSGTTGLQKAVMLSHRAVLEHIGRYGEAIGLNPSDRVVSWLPLYHDMGLIACFHLPLGFGIPVVQLDPFEWISAPVLMLEAICKERGTLAWVPNFVYDFMAQRIRTEDLEGIDLGSLRMLINCSEPVRQKSHDRFFRRFSKLGFRRQSLATCYAMAETTFAVTQTTPNKEPRCLSANQLELAKGRFVPAGHNDEDIRLCVSSGAPITGCAVRVVDESGEELPDDQVGEIVIQSVSMFDGYRNDMHATAVVLKDGWYFSGDYGFRHEGEQFIIGRKKDIIIVAGKNLFPEDIEDAVGEVPGVIPGRVIAFGREDEEAGTEQVCVIAETEYEHREVRSELRLGIVRAGMEIDVTISRVYLVCPRWLIKSSSGKPARNSNKVRALTQLGTGTK